MNIKHLEVESTHFPMHAKFKSFTGLIVSVCSFALTVSILSSCASTSSKSVTSTNAKAGRTVDQLVLVDCLLPGQVRKLGSQMTFVTPRQPLRTTANNCSIRGGEYTLYDRANLTSSLNIWTPLAQSGEAEAQNYLGEIYESGVNGSPDYQLAALWFQRAADQGLKAAQINLGLLYESGKGVAKDEAKALNYYRLAAGLSNDQLEYMSVIDKKVAEQVELWQNKLRKSQQQTEQQKTKVDELQSQLAKAHKQSQQLLAQSTALNMQNDKPSPQLLNEIALLKKQQSELTTKLEQQEQTIVALRQIARQERAHMSYQIDGLHEHQLELAKQINAKDAELVRFKSLIQEITAQYETEKSAYLESLTKMVNNQENNSDKSQQTIAVQSLQLSELQKNINFYQQQERIYQDNIKHQKQQLANQQEQSDEFKRMSQSTIDSLLLELQQTKTLLDNDQQRYARLLNENNTLTETLANERNSTADKTKENSALSIELADKVTQISNKHDRIIRLEEQVDQLNAKLAGLTLLANNEPKGQMRSITKVNDTSSNDNPLTKAFGEFHALIIGNDKYQYLDNLQTASADAISLEKILSTQYGYKTTLLLNATRYDIISKLSELEQTLDSTSNLLLYYAGHGTINDAKGHWLPVDAKRNNQANWIPIQQISDVISSFDARKIIIIADSCYSGLLTRNSILSNGFKVDIENPKHMRWLNAMSKGKSRTVLTSGGLQPVLDGGFGEHSVFAKHFLAALEENKTVIDALSLYNRIFPAVKQDAITMNVEQSPQYAPMKSANHHAVDYFFINQQLN